VDNDELAFEMLNVTKKVPSGDSYMDVLKGVDLIGKKGKILIITGPSGCGKTTLLSVLAGTLHFDGGEVNIFEHSLQNLSDPELTEFRKKNVGFIFQQLHLIGTLNCQKNIAVPLLLNGYTLKEALQKSNEMLHLLGLKERKYMQPSRLSGGEQQKVAIGRALIHNPKLLICDEPTASLDAKSGSKIMEILRKITRSPERCVVVVTHDNRIMEYADCIAKMEDGIIVDYQENF
jgi:putative ABC transport system ATP-binding protein